MRIEPQTLENLAAALEEAAAAKFARIGAEAMLAALKPLVTLKGDRRAVLDHLAPYELVEPGGLTFAVNAAYLEKALARGAGAVIVDPELAERFSGPALICLEPRLAFTLLLERFGQAMVPPPAPADDSQIFFKDRDSVQLGPGVVVGPQTYIGAGVSIGRETLIYPQVFIEDGVQIGEDCLIHPRVVLRWGTVLGRRVIIHAGAVIGEDGFGYSQIPNPLGGRLYHLKNVHLGGVILGDDVEVGAGAAIDRGLIESTRIGQGTKIDNLAQIAHNVQIGRDNIIVAQAGLAGHVRTGDRAFLLGQAGLAPGARIGDDAILSAQSGLTGVIPPGRKVWSGSPARPQEEHYQIQALARRELPRIKEFFRLLKASSSLEELKKKFFSRP